MNRHFPLAVRNVVVVMLVFFAVSVLAFGQTGSISGTVQDAAGAVVAGAQVTVRNEATNSARETLTGPTGTYSIPDLPVGPYQISVIKTGFKTFRASSVQLTVAQALTVNAKLDPGAVSEEVQVRGDELPAVDLETSQISNLVESRKIQDLPLITRNPYDLVLLSPGTSQTNSRLGGFTVNGSRERNNNILLDGVDNNDTSVPAMVPVIGVNPDSTEEFRVITNNFNAEFGRNTGAIIDVVTKSGTNAFHGGAYEFGRWNGFGGARDWFNKKTDPQDPYIRHQFGFSFGGPIIKDKTFFFANTEFNRFITTITNTAVVPTPAFKTGVFNYTFVDNVGAHTVPVDLRPGSPQNNNNLPLDPTMQKILALYPNPSVENGDGFSGTLFFPSPSRTSSYNPVVKLDHHFTDHQVLSVRYGYNHFTDPDPVHSAILPGAGSVSQKNIGQNIGAQLTSTFSPVLVNTLQFGWNHIYSTFNCRGLDILDSVSQQEGTIDAFGNGRDYNMNPFTSFGCTALVSNGQFRKTGTTSYGDTLSWVRGSHTLKFGAGFRTIGETGPNSFNSRRQIDTRVVFTTGSRVFSPITVNGATSVLGDAASALYGLVIEDTNAQFFDKNGVRQGTDSKDFRQHEYDWYGQDTWKIRTNLTLTLGLRYQFDGVPFEEHGNFSNILTNPSAFPVVFSTVGPGTGKSFYQSDYSNIEPRIGFSWDPWGDGKTAVRGGFGIFHDRVFGNLFGNARGNPPFEQDYDQFPLQTINNAMPPGFAYNGIPQFQVSAFPLIVPSNTPSTTIADGTGLSTAVVFDTHFRNPSSNNWNFGIQRELPGANTIDVSYIGSKGTHIFRSVDGNPPDPALVAELVDFCSDPLNAFECTTNDVSGINLYNGADFGVLPFNAVAHNALIQPAYQRSVGNSSYNALQIKFTHRLNHGLQFQGAYTWAHSLDDSSDPIDPAQGNRTFPRNSRNLHQDWGNSDNDIRHIAVFNYIWEVPLGKGKTYFNNGVLGRIFEGMQFSGLTSLQTGHPFEVRSSTDSQRTGISSWGELVGDPFAPGSSSNTDVGKPFFTNPTAFAQPPFGRAGNIARNQFYGPNYINFDLAFSKKIRVTERVAADLRFEGFNIFNHPHFTNPGDSAGSPGNLIGTGVFGISTSTVGRPDGTTSARQMQVALKLSF